MSDKIQDENPEARPAPAPTGKGPIAFGDVAAVAEGKFPAGRAEVPNKPGAPAPVLKAAGPDPTASTPPKEVENPTEAERGTSAPPEK